jgi:hypothetical protein
MFVTVILAAMVGTALTPIYPRVEQPPRYVRTTNPAEQPATLSYARQAEDLTRPPTVEPSSEDGGTSRHAKTLLAARVDPAENQAPGSASASAPEQPATKSTTQAADVAATGSVDPPSIATSDSPGSLRGPAVSFAAAAKRVADRCMSCHRGFRPRGIQLRSGVRRRIRMTQDRFTAF